MKAILTICIVLVFASCVVPTPELTPEPTPTTTPIPIVPGVSGRFLFADGPPPDNEMNITLAECNLDAPVPYCTISSDSVWQMPVEGRFSFEADPGDYGIAAYVSWLPFVILLNWPGSEYPILFSIENEWLDLGDIEYSDPWGG